MSKLSRYDGSRELRWASENGHLEIVKILLDEGIRYDRALWWADRHGHLEVVELLKEYGFIILEDQE